MDKELEGRFDVVYKRMAVLERELQECEVQLKNLNEERRQQIVAERVQKEEHEKSQIYPDSAQCWRNMDYMARGGQTDLPLMPQNCRYCNLCTENYASVRFEKWTMYTSDFLQDDDDDDISHIKSFVPVMCTPCYQEAYRLRTRLGEEHSYICGLDLLPVDDLSRLVVSYLFQCQ